MARRKLLIENSTEGVESLLQLLLHVLRLGYMEESRGEEDCEEVE